VHDMAVCIGEGGGGVNGNAGEEGCHRNTATTTFIILGVLFKDIPVGAETTYRRVASGDGWPSSSLFRTNT
jgi:hypothetical protein